MIVFGVSMLICANLMFCIILGEVNGTDPAHQISPWFVNIKFFLVLRRHAEFFPISRRRMQMKWMPIARFVLAFAGLLIAAARANATV